MIRAIRGRFLLAPRSRLTLFHGRRDRACVYRSFPRPFSAGSKITVICPVLATDLRGRTRIQQADEYDPRDPRQVVVGTAFSEVERTRKRWQTDVSHPPRPRMFRWCSAGSEITSNLCCIFATDLRGRRGCSRRTSMIRAIRVRLVLHGVLRKGRAQEIRMADGCRPSPMTPTSWNELRRPRPAGPCPGPQNPHPGLPSAR